MSVLSDRANPPATIETGSGVTMDGIHVHCESVAQNTAAEEDPTEEESSDGHRLSWDRNSPARFAEDRARLEDERAEDCVGCCGSRSNDPDEMMRWCAATDLPVEVNWALDPFHPEVEEVYQASKVPAGNFSACFRKCPHCCALTLPPLHRPCAASTYGGACLL